MVFDGQRLRQSWSEALNDALVAFRGHLTSAQSSQWKRVPTRENSTGGKGKARALLSVHHGNVVVHRRPTKVGDVYRAVADISLGGESVDLDALNAVLSTPELRQEWDPAVEASKIIEMFDPSTRIVKTKFTLGWPANPRDAVLISRSFKETNTVINVSTSLPRSSDEPAYLRPSPPYVRSHVNLFAWCIQFIPPQMQPVASESRTTKRNSGSARLRVTCFWQHDLKSLWGMGSAISPPQQLHSMIDGLLTTLKERGLRVAVLSGYGNEVAVERVIFDKGRESLTVEYTITEDQDEASHEALHGLDELHIVKEQRRLHRSVECILPNPEGWDIRISTRGSSESVTNLPWSAMASQEPNVQEGNLRVSTRVSFTVKHAAMPDSHSVLKVKLAIEPAGGSKGIRLNGLTHPVQERQIRDPVSVSMSNQLTQEASSSAEFSFRTASSVPSITTSEASGSSTPKPPPLLRVDSEGPRTMAADKSIMARIRRSYIYFSSLLQEPEAKWRRNTEARGVSVTQLDSIDPTLVVYRAEATFVGIGLWDLYSAVMTPGARIFWDKQYDDAILIEDVNELSELWHYKTKPAWPVVGRDAVVLRTVYKSPTTVHVFAFSADDSYLFANIPSAELNVIRTQVDLQGWSIEALSPNTTLVTLLEQSDPKGWSGKSTIPQQMIYNVAGVGEFAIRCGGPPLVTRLSGAKASSSRYDHERGSFRIEYTASNGRKARVNDIIDPDNEDYLDNGSDDTTLGSTSSPENRIDAIECELRCDLDTWATSLDIIIDPPPQTISCLRRHRLSTGGGGVWLTIGHDGVYGDDDRFLVIVRRAPVTAGKEKGVVMVNGKRIGVDVEDLPESEVKSLARQKRIKPIRVPLDQPPVFNAIRKRRAELLANDTSDVEESSPIFSKGTTTTLISSSPKVPSPLVNFFTMAMEQATTTTQQAVAALTPPMSIPDEESSKSKTPMQHCLEALAFIQAYHSGSYRDNWSLVTDKGLQVHRRPSPEISPVIPVHKGEKVIENVIAEDVAAAITSYDCRKRWDDRFDSAAIFEEFGGECRTSFTVNKGGFPFRDRGFYIASMVAREPMNAQSTPSESSTSPGPSINSSAIYYVSASFNPDSVNTFSAAKYNPSILPVGRMLVDAWILETLDPYTSENYAIPSTRCTRLVAVDYAGSVPMAFNSMINSTLPKSIVALESFLKGFTPYPEMKLPALGLVSKASEAGDSKYNTWVLRRDNPCRTLVHSHFADSSRVYKGIVMLSLSDGPLSFQPSFEEKPARPNEPNFPSRQASPDITSLRRQEHSISTPATPVRHRRVSSAANPMTPSGSRLRSRSRSRLATPPPSFVVPNQMKQQGSGDFVVAELAVDSKLYNGGYNIQMTSNIQTNTNPGNPIDLSSVIEQSTSPPSENILPLSCSVFALPLSPLNTSGTKGDSSSRHLIRITLPTAQYEMPDVHDLLTGETRSAPAKPAWFKDLEDKQKRAIVRIEIRPLTGTGTKKGKMSVMVDDIAVPVGSEVDLKKVGQSHRDYDLSTLGVLSRIAEEGVDVMPKQLVVPLAVANHLHDPEKLLDVAKDMPSVGRAASSDALQGGDSQTNDAIVATPEEMTPVDEKAPVPEVEPSLGLLKFLNAYPTNLLRFASSSSSSPSRSISRSTSSIPNASTSVSSVGDAAISVVRAATIPRYSVSTLICVTLIAFLLGSLLRSLLSPADFIYVVSDLEDAPARVVGQANGGLSIIEPGWREIRRLVEVKYIVGGWDFQIAVVRRH